MRSNASLAAVFLLLAGCVGSGGRSHFEGQYAGPIASQGQAAEDDGDAPREPRPRRAPPAQQQAVVQPEYGGDTYGRPRLADPSFDQAPGASYQRPDAYPAAQDAAYGQPDDYAAPAEAAYSRPASSYPAQDGARYPAPAGAAYRRPATSYAPPQQDTDPAAGMQGPRGSSQPGQGEARYDEVGYAGVRGVAGGEANGGAVVAIARGVAPGSYLEVTSLENGRTILVLVTGVLGEADHPVDLSPAAARLLGAQGESVPVRVRKVAASPADAAALRNGQPAAERPETPPVLLTALRKHLTGRAPVASYDPAPSQYAPEPVRQPARPVAGGHYFVQIAALSNAANAQALARSLGGSVRPGGGLHRVQLGPYRTAGEAEAARANVARRGYGDARVLTQ